MTDSPALASGSVAVSEAETEAGFRVALELFEGPLDLLLTLIQRERLEITTIALAQVTDQFLSHLTRLQAIDAGAIAAFCETAATLMLIKSRALLPRLAATLEDPDTEALDLAERLREYRRFKAVAEGLGERERAGMRAYVRTAPPPDIQPEIRPGEASVGDLAAAFEAALAEAAAEAAAQETKQGEPAPRQRLRLASRFAEIRTMLIRGGRVSFREVLLGQGADREYIIVSFLAVLELLRRRFVRAVQTEIFGDIELEARPDAVGWETDEEEMGDGFLDERDEG
jgi:segregation and condensation protein A